MTDRDERTARRIEVATAILLSAAGLMSAWASYQASLWGGVQASHYAQATTMATESSRLSILDGQAVATDTAMFMQWLNAAADDDEKRMAFFERRFSPEMNAIFVPWRARQPQAYKDVKVDAQAPQRLPQPQHAEGRMAREYASRSDEAFAKGERANGFSDRYVAATVVLSTVLFLGGISPLLKRNRVRLALLALAGLLGLVSSFYILGLPISGL